MTPIHVNLMLTSDTPNSMNFLDTYEGLEEIWYKFSVDVDGNIDLWANADGFEHLARYFLKMARFGQEYGLPWASQVRARKPPRAPRTDDRLLQST
jgi:hypothetical protein